MKAGERTKKMIADALIELMTKKTLNKIRVHEICNMCGIERQVFYYHFRDKYDLVAWIYGQDLFNAITDAGWIWGKEYITKHLALIKQKHQFYRRAFEDISQNSLIEYMRNMNIRFTMERYCILNNTDIIPENELFRIQFLSYGWTYCIIDWINGKLSYSAEQIAEYLLQNINVLYKCAEDQHTPYYPSDELYFPDAPHSQH